MKRNPHRDSSNGLIYNKNFWIGTILYLSIFISLAFYLKFPIFLKVLFILAGLLISIILSTLSIIFINFISLTLISIITDQKYSNKVLKIISQSFYINLLEKISTMRSLPVTFLSLGQYEITKNLINNEFSNLTIYKNILKSSNSSSIMQSFLNPAYSPLGKLTDNEKDELCNILIERIFLSKETLEKELKNPMSLTKCFYPSIFLMLSVPNSDPGGIKGLCHNPDNIEKIVKYILSNGEQLFIVYQGEHNCNTANYYYEALRNFGENQNINQATINALYSFAIDSRTTQLMNSNPSVSVILSDLKRNISNNPNFKIEEYMNEYLDNFVSI